jgi:alkylated DNA nucleotide flippase Atl1
MLIVALRLALKFLEPGNDIPWQRVVSSTGAISSRGPGTDGAERQRIALEEDGVEVIPERVGPEGEAEGGGRVKLAEWGWFPDSIEFDE